MEEAVESMKCNIELVSRYSLIGILSVSAASKFQSIYSEIFWHGFSGIESVILLGAVAAELFLALALLRPEMRGFAFSASAILFFVFFFYQAAISPVGSPCHCLGDLGATQRFVRYLSFAAFSISLMGMYVVRSEELARVPKLSSIAVVLKHWACCCVVFVLLAAASCGLNFTDTVLSVSKRPIHVSRQLSRNGQNFRVDVPVLNVSGEDVAIVGFRQPCGLRVGDGSYARIPAGGTHILSVEAGFEGGNRFVNIALPSYVCVDGSLRQSTLRATFAR